jgi:hypothetical protein
VTIRKLRLQRTATLTLLGLGAIVAGLWVLGAVLFSVGVGVAVGLISGGIATLVVEGLS